MGTKNLPTPEAHIHLAEKRFINEIMYGNIIRAMGSVWVFACNYVFSVFKFIIRLVFRSQANDSRNEYVLRVIPSQQDDHTGIDGFREEEDGFRLQNSTSGNKSNEERGNCNSTTANSGSKYEFMSGEGISGFLEGTKTMSFRIQECYADSYDYTVCSNQILGTGIFSTGDVQINSEEEAHPEKTEEPVDDFAIGKVSGEAEEEKIAENWISGSGEIVDSERNSLGTNDVVDEVESVSEDCSLRFGSEQDSISSSGELSMNNHTISREYFAVQNVGEVLKPEALLVNDVEKVEDVLEIESRENIEELSSCETSLVGFEEIVALDPSYDSDEEYIELETNFQNLRRMEVAALSGVEPGEAENKNERVDIVEELKPENNLEKSEETALQEKPPQSSSENENDLDIQWEHEDVLQQLKMELKNLRNGGLPTILEEEETDSPSMVAGLKPLKIDEKLEYKDRMEEIQKVHKIYADKMRKLDMLNSQTMHAIGFLQLKDPLPSLFPYILWPRKGRRVTADPMQKFNEELQSDLELVYVGQVCLSWEILHWQFGKAQELQEYDSQGSHRYNQVAGEFQLFQVLLQRFIENEPFQGPRVETYVNNRCVLRSLLHVPAIKDYCTKDKRARREEEEDVISGSMMARIIEESMRLFWEFLRADKDDGKMHMLPKGPRQKHGNLKMSDEDLPFLMEVHADLQKKEKKLKDILRSGNCIVKKFQKHHSDHLDQALCFAQVELKLISRVLSMSRLTRDQLVWCHEKLDQINFISRRIHVEPSFFLFPC
ncbi:hypothetical protein CJ030_MR7G023873 [Morella rubra]|uniref:Ribosomal protein L34Ae n=1 Tax=Morella rubra TaxID=262757 RepID=A0A6A1V692_9ROSI|nr:hypothetical protein CJ030_MR7G023873 [Morella rubra]